MPVLPRMFRGKRDTPQTERSRDIRQGEKYYTGRLYSPELAEHQAPMDYDIGQALKRKRGLKGIKLTGVSN